MPSLSFEKRFAPRVESGEKTHSIRAPRKRPEQWMPGKRVHLFTAMRTKHCRKLGTGILKPARDITIAEDCAQIDDSLLRSARDLSAFARSDGFLTWNEFVTFFREHYGLPWSGVLISWRLEPKA